MKCKSVLFVLTVVGSTFFSDGYGNDRLEVVQTPQSVTIDTPQLEAVIRKEGYVSGIAGGSFLDKQTGFRDRGHGLDIADFILEPGSDEAYRDQLPARMVYHYGDPFHGQRAKRKIEGPQICTQARKLTPRVIQGEDFVAVVMTYQFTLAAPSHQPGSTWTQTIVFPAGKRYFISSQRIDSVNASPAMFFRIDMPGHIKHHGGDTFSEVFLSYHGRVPASAFLENFPPDEKYNYRRDRDPLPHRFIRAYKLRDPKTGESGPWLAGMTLKPAAVWEAWCHQRNYVCMIEEFGGNPIQAGEHFSAAFVVGYFDSVRQMETIYDQYRDGIQLAVDDNGWKLLK